ncbi:hypothetical protein GLOIN_2v1644515, partial [Rhizophagus irregularis DAOM 181602=DAOM 197198]
MVVYNLKYFIIFNCKSSFFISYLFFITLLFTRRIIIFSIFPWFNTSLHHIQIKIIIKCRTKAIFVIYSFIHIFYM